MAKLNGETMSDETDQETLQTVSSEGLSTVDTEQNASQQQSNADSEYNMMKSYTRIPFKLWKHPASLDQIKLKRSNQNARKKVPKPKNSKNDKDKNAIKSPHHSSDDKLLPAVNVHKISKVFPTLNTYKLQLARERTENAIKLNQIFTIQGGYSSVRYYLRQRGWVENYFQTTKICKQPQVKTIPLDDIHDATGDDADNIEEDYNDNSNVKFKEEDGLYNIMIMPPNGLHLTEQVFTHGQLYVSCSRVRNPESFFIYIENEKLRNVVYQEALQRKILFRRQTNNKLTPCS